MLTVALSKGRILEETLPLFEAVGIQPGEDLDKTRKLIIPTNQADVRFVLLRASDVATYVQFGAADAGVVGKDLLMEHGGNDMYELLDLGISRCRMVVAEPRHLAESDDPEQWTRLRIATKYPNITRRHFSSKGVQTEIIKLYGSMELAPLVGLADRIVDIVDTGNTMRANGLVEVERIADVSSRLVVNRASMKLKSRQLNDLVGSLGKAVKAAAESEPGQAA